MLFSPDDFQSDIWLEGDAVYRAYNMRDAVKPKIPPKPNHMARSTVSRYQRFKTMQWEVPNYPYVAFLPRRRKFAAPFLQSLGTHPSQVPLRKICLPNTILLALEKPYRDRWRHLEDILFRVCTHLEKACPTLGRVARPWKPSVYFDNKTDASKENELRGKLWAGVDQFFLVLAYISFIIAHFDDFVQETDSDGCTVEGPAWRFVLGKAKVHPDIVDMLIEVGVGDWSEERLGSIIDLKICPFPDKLGMLIRRNLPVILYWPSSDPTYIIRESLPPQYFERFSIKSEEDLMEIIKWLKRFEVPSDVVLQLTSKSGDATIDVEPQNAICSTEVDRARVETGSSMDRDYPVLDWRSGQRMYETREEFMARRAQQRTLNIDSESTRDKALQLKREELAKNYKPPEVNARTSVFLWAKEGDRSWDVRRKLGSGLVNSLWYSYSPQEMFYYSLEDEWDLWRHDAGRASRCDDKLAWEDTLETDSVLDQTAGTDGVESDYGSSDISGFEETWDVLEEHVNLSLQETFLDVVKAQLGYREQKESEQVDAPREILTWSDNKLKRVLLLGRLDIDDLNLQRIKHLAYSLCAGGDVPGTLWDLQDVNLLQFGNNKICVTSGFHTEEIPGSVEGELEAYEVKYETGNKNIRIFVLKGYIALELKRMTAKGEITRHEDIPLYMLYRGIPFLLTSSHAHLSSSKPPVELEVAPQMRSKGYIPDKRDYQRYLSRRQEFVRSEKGSKVLRMGGILWRLALESIPPSDGARLCNGGKGQRHKICQVGDPLDVDDMALTKDELGLVYGLYQTHSSDSSEPVNCSWWPNPFTWKNSGLDTGRWTHFCEEWYQRRRKLLEEGNFDEAKLHSIDQWRKNLRFSAKETKAIMNRLDAKSRSVIVGGETI